MNRFQIDHTTSTDSSRGGFNKVIDLEHHSAGIRHLDSFSVRETKHFVIIEDSIHVLDPHGIDRSIEVNPALDGSFDWVITFAGIYSCLDETRDNTLLPFVCIRVGLTIEFSLSDGFGIEHLYLHSFVPALRVNLSVDEKLSKSFRKNSSNS
jgi:hypothetical protein